MQGLRLLGAIIGWLADCAVKALKRKKSRPR